MCPRPTRDPARESLYALHSTDLPEPLPHLSESRTMTKNILKALRAASATLLFSASVLPQSVSAGESGGNAWIFAFGVLAVIATGAFVAIFMKRRESARRRQEEMKQAAMYRLKASKAGSYGSENRVSKPSQASDSAASNPSLHGIDIDDVKEKMERIRFERLPINRFESLDAARPFTALPVGDEEELLSAIDESDVEFVNDEAVREAAIDTISAYKTRNSVEALSQVALYDISSALRSKAVGILAEFDHMSVFETIILTCADPSREVRAAGARALFRVSFSRANAWLLVCECSDRFRVTQVAKAALEADFVNRSLERLVHEDIHYVHEAVALLSLLIKAEETDDIFEYLRTGEDTNVKWAILKVFSVSAEDSVFEKLGRAVDEGAIGSDIEKDARKALEMFGLIAA